MEPNDFESKVAINAVSHIFKEGLSTFKNAALWAHGKTKQYDILGFAARKYSSSLKELMDNVRILGMSKPIPLRQIFVKVNILKSIQNRRFASIRELEETFDKDKRNFGEIRNSRVSGIDALNSISKYIVLGKPGAGKTTFLKHICLETLSGKIGSPALPIFISLKSHSDSDLSLIQSIMKQFSICEMEDFEEFVKHLMKKGKLLFLLDGLDEVNAHRSKKVIKEINDLSKTYRKNRFIISCRIAAYNYCFELFEEVEIANFDSDQIDQFVGNWFADSKPIAALFKKEIYKNPAIAELGKTPLLLTLLCIAFQENLRFPPSRGELYKEAIDALIKKWDSSRGIRRDEIYKSLSNKRKEGLFSAIAAKSFERGNYFFRQLDLESEIGYYLNNLPGYNEASEPDNGNILKAIEAQHGIFIERAKGIYSFSHLTFQEYFTAKYISDNSARGTVKRCIRLYFTRKDWREVTLLTVELLSNADEFFLEVNKKLKTLGKKANRQNVFKDIDKIIFFEGKDSLLNTRLLTLRYFKNDDTVPIDKLFKYLSPQRFSSFAANSYFKNVDFTHKRTKISQMEIVQKIEKNEFMDLLIALCRSVECLNTECYVSAKIRNKIKNTMAGLLIQESF